MVMMTKKLTYKQVDWATLAQGVVGQLSSASLTFSERLQVTSTKHRYVSAYANAGYTYDSKYSLNARCEGGTSRPFRNGS